LKDTHNDNKDDKLGSDAPNYMVTVVVMIRTMTLMIAIPVDISIDNHRWFTPTAVAGIGPITESQKCKICHCVTTTVVVHVEVIKIGQSFILFVAETAYSF